MAAHKYDSCDHCVHHRESSTTKKGLPPHKQNGGVHHGNAQKCGVHSLC